MENDLQSNGVALTLNMLHSLFNSFSSMLASFPIHAPILLYVLSADSFHDIEEKTNPI
jgi:hypothetical protein